MGWEDGKNEKTESKLRMPRIPVTRESCRGGDGQVHEKS